ncbi:MAG TPA: membrane protein insertase YidC [bacterium]|nr:membrane protein insertase YidC [bacterium]
MNKNMILAVVLSVVVLYVWGEFFAPKPQLPLPEQSGSVENSAVTSPDNQNATPQEKSDTALQQGPDAATQAATATPATRPADGELFRHGPIAPTAQNPAQNGTLNGTAMTMEYTSKGGRLTALSVTGEKYRNKRLDMLAALRDDAYFPEMSSIFTQEPAYAVEEASGNAITFRYEQEGLIEWKTLRFSGDYLLTVSKKVVNNSAAPINWRPALRYRSIHADDKIFSSYGKVFEFLVKTTGEGMKEPSSGEKLKEETQGRQIQWAGVNYGFFLYAAVGKEQEALTVDGVIDSKQNLTVLTTAHDEFTIAPGQTAEATFTIFLGPKEVRLLEQAGNDLRASASLGWFGFLAEPLLWILNFFYDFVKNYGIAIILLTILVKLLLWPLSDASYKSMAKMKKLMPKVEDLKKKYKEDKETLNKEIMLLYQKEGVNPLGGCLPILIQMPIYIALYSMLNNAVELYNAGFLPFWLIDLSEKDPYYILPVALGGFMFLQQKMTPTQMDNQQAKIMLYVMPVMFAGFMLFLPAGLNLYILANTLLGILQQWLVTKRYG